MKVLTRRIHFTYVRSNLFTPSAKLIAKLTRERRGVREAGFENTICEFIDVANLIRKIKNINKKAILVYEAMGYDEWEIAIELGISAQAVSKNRKWVENFIKEIQDK